MLLRVQGRRGGSLVEKELLHTFLQTEKKNGEESKKEKLQEKKKNQTTEQRIDQVLCNHNLLKAISPSPIGA